MRDMVRGIVNMDAARFEKEFPVLSHHLGPENVSLLLRLAETQELPAGHVLIEDMAPVDAVYLIVSGEVSVELKAKDETLLLGRLGKGKWVGEVSLFNDDHLSSAGVVTDVPTTVLSLKHADFFTAQSQHPGLVGALTQVFLDLMTQRLRASDQIPQAAGDQGLAFPGSDALMRSDDADARQGWLKTMLKKLSGVEG
jgi:CRP-like cAMP-binding protein